MNKRGLPPTGRLKGHPDAKHWVARATSIPVIVALLACSFASSTPVNGPDGEPGWYSVTCKRDMGNCFEEAGDRCPHGYVTEDDDRREGTVHVANYNQYGGYSSTVPRFRGHLLIKCK